MSAGKDSIGVVDGAALILRKLRERLAPDAIDSSSRNVAKFMYFGRAAQNMDAYLEFDMLRQKGEARMLMGSGFPSN